MIKEEAHRHHLDAPSPLVAYSSVLTVDTDAPSVTARTSIKDLVNSLAFGERE